tara:strand:- start:5146 stop:5502 length:357 start_codon:yes stop_codon:yes gene_type:complete
MDWNYIKQFHKNPPTGVLHRHPDIQKKYELNKSKVGYVDDLFKRLFKYNQEYVIVPNTYPYHFKDDTKHYIYWSQKPIDYCQLEGNLEKLHKEYIYFENLNGNKSIKGIHHAHIFFKN